MKETGYKNEELVTLQADLKVILNGIDCICKKHNIQYFAVSGTLLGAIRHKDIIPWDDDIDIGMTRDNYEKFLKVCADELGNNFFVLNYKTEKHFYAYFTKICLHGTVFVEKETKGLNYEHGVFVDIFPYDFVPDSSKELKKHLKKVKFLYQLFKCKSLWKVSDLSTGFKKIVGSFVRPLMHILLLPVSKKRIFNLLDARLQKYNNESHKKLLPLFKTKMAICSEDLNNIISVSFGNCKIPVSSSYDRLLRNEYGDYMVLPPKEKRKSHAPIILKL